MQFKFFTLVVALATQATASVLERQVNQLCCIPPGLQCILKPNPPLPPYLNICCPPFLCTFDPTDPQSPIGVSLTRYTPPTKKLIGRPAEMQSAAVGCYLRGSKTEKGGFAPVLESDIETYPYPRCLADPG
jgi:hypothetical protein